MKGGKWEEAGSLDDGMRLLHWEGGKTDRLLFPRCAHGEMEIHEHSVGRETRQGKHEKNDDDDDDSASFYCPRHS